MSRRPLRALGLVRVLALVRVFALGLILGPGLTGAAVGATEGGELDALSGAGRRAESGVESDAAAAVRATPAQRQAAEFVRNARNDQVRRLEAALKGGIDPNTSTPEDGPAIVAAAMHQSWEAVALLARTPGIDLERTNPRGDTALMLVALRGQLALTRQLLEAGAEPNRPGWTPLHYAAIGGDLALVKLLLEHNAYLDAASPNGTTPLMMAAREKRDEIARHLLEEGADPTPRNTAGLSAADYFERTGSTALAASTRERARAFEARYGTVQSPRRVAPLPTDPAVGTDATSPVSGGATSPSRSAPAATGDPATGFQMPGAPAAPSPVDAPGRLP